MHELDGSWSVKRTEGLLPPLVGVRKEIRGPSGKTKIGSLLSLQFDVDGLRLRYRKPLSGFVDELQREGEGYRGRALFRGREYAQFEMKRIF